MQVEEETTTSSTTMMDPWSLFLYGMKAPMTREKYRGRVTKFFDFIGFTEGTIEERAKIFTERGKKRPEWVFVSVLHFVQAQKLRKLIWLYGGNMGHRVSTHEPNLCTLRVLFPTSNYFSSLLLPQPSSLTLYLNLMLFFPLNSDSTCSIFSG
jgi:hypothetical protein